MNFDTVVSQSGEVDEDFISPITEQGVMLVNGAIHTGALTAATRNTNPKYTLPSGQSAQMVGLTRRAALVYRPIDENNYLGGFGSRGDNTTVMGLTALNGQGHAGESQASFMSRIQVIGIAQQDTENNGSKRFNIHIGGMYTMINNSNRDIVAGDWLMAYAPRADEIKQGGRGKEHDANGYLELWMVPYHPSIHQVTTANIYQCLSLRYNDRNPSRPHSVNGKEYIEEYETMCDILLDSFMDIGITFLEFLASSNVITVNKNLQAGTGAAANRKERAEAYAKLLARLDHSHFMSKDQKVPEDRKRLIDSLFVERLSQKDKEGNDVDYFDFPIMQQSSTTKKLRDSQMGGVAKGLVEMARLNHTITKNVFGKALTSAAPKKNLNVQLCSMIGCK